MDLLDWAFSEETGLDTTRRCQDIQSINVVGLGNQTESGVGSGPSISCIIPSAGKFSPTVIDKSQPIESMGSRLRDEKYEVIEGVDFPIQLLYTLNL